jgi:translation initiation factor 2 beta subunit (eIF-2beta)/eIF-5
MDIMKEKGRLMELEKINEEREHEEKVKKEKQHTIQREITEKSKAIKKQTKQLEEYVSKFLETTGRKPHPDEIIDNMKTIIEKEIIDRFLEKYSITQYTMNSDTKV